MIRRRRDIRGMVVCLALLGALWLAPRVLGDVFLVNVTPSVPLGLYMRDFAKAPERGDIVALTPPANARPFLASLRYPTDAPLLKSIAGAAGDYACANGNWLHLGHRQLTRLVSANGMPRWSGCRTLTPDEVFVLGGTNPESFDSRYFGPLPRTAIRGVYRLIASW